MDSYDYWVKRGRIYRNEQPIHLLQYSDTSLRGQINDKRLKYHSENQRERTPAEKVFAQYLTDMPMRFFTELPIPGRKNIYFADFFLRAPYFVIIEIDGGVHDTQQDYDVKRDTEIMASTGWSILRFTNDQVLSNDEKMWELFWGTILEICELEKYRANGIQFGIGLYKNFMFKHSPNVAKRVFKNDLHIARYERKKMLRYQDNGHLLYEYAQAEKNPNEPEKIESFTQKSNNTAFSESLGGRK